MSMETSAGIGRNFRAIFVGKFIAALSMWLAIMILAKMSDLATVGTYALAQAICIPLSEIGKMSLREVRSSDTRDLFPFGTYVGLRILTAGGVFAAVVIVGGFQSENPQVFMVIAIYALIRCVEMLSDMIYGLFQAQERMEYIGRSLCLVGPLSLLLLAAGYAMSGSLIVAVLGQLVAHLSVFLFYDLPNGRQRMSEGFPGQEGLAPDWNPGMLYRLARLALPLTFATLLIMIAQHLPRVAVEHFLGLSALGLFAAIMSMAMAPDRLIQSLGVAISVQLARMFADGNLRRFVILLGSVLVAVLLCGLAGIAVCFVLGETILRTVYTEAYADQSPLLIMLVAAVCFRLMANVLKFGLIAAQRFWWLTLQSAVSAAVAIGACAVLIPHRGLQGAGLAVLMIFSAQFITSFLGMIIALFIAQRSLRVRQ